MRVSTFPFGLSFHGLPCLIPSYISESHVLLMRAFESPPALVGTPSRGSSLASSLLSLFLIDLSILVASVQVEFADIIIINKIDRVTDEELATLKGILRKLNAEAKFIDTRFSKVRRTAFVSVAQPL